MKRFLVLILVLSGLNLNAQNNNLVSHFEAYYNQMKSQGDIQGMINGLTHLNVLQPSQARKDTLGFIYMREGMHMQALNTLGIELGTNDSDIAVEVKAISLKAVGQPERAITHFNELFKRDNNALIAYELAELNLQTNNAAEANKHIQYGIANAKDDMNKAFFETQTPYQVPLKAAFLYLKGLAKFNENKTINIDAAVDLLDEALKLAPNFNLAQISKDALLSQKQQQTKN